MNPDPIRERLKKMTVPVATESARSRARHRALIALQQRGSAAAELSGGSTFTLKWRYLLPLLVVAALIPFLFHRPPVQAHAPTENLADDRQILDQMEKLFPNQVDSVVEENGKIDLSVAQSSTVGSDQPVVVVFRKDGQAIRILSYSGHHVCLALGGQHSCFDILATPTGGVILETKDKVLLGSERPVVAGYSVQAQTLEASL